MATSTYRITYSHRADTPAAAVAGHIRTLCSGLADPRDRRTLARLMGSMNRAGWLSAQRSDVPQRTLVAFAHLESDARSRATWIAAQRLYCARRHEILRVVLVAGDSPPRFDRLMTAEGWWRDSPRDPFPDMRALETPLEHLSSDALASHVVARIAERDRPGRVDGRHSRLRAGEWVSRCLSRLGRSVSADAHPFERRTSPLPPARFRDVVSRVNAWRSVPSPQAVQFASREKAVAA